MKGESNHEELHEWLVLIQGVLDEIVELVHISCMVFAIMERNRVRRNERLKRLRIKRQRAQGNNHGGFKLILQGRWVGKEEGRSRKGGEEERNERKKKKRDKPDFSFSSLLFFLYSHFFFYYILSNLLCQDQEGHGIQNPWELRSNPSSPATFCRRSQRDNRSTLPWSWPASNRLPRHKHLRRQTRKPENENPGH